MIRKYDATVTVLGSGVAGCATALALCLSGVQEIWVLSRTRNTAVSVGESIPPDTRYLLQELGVWDGFIRQNHAPCMGSVSAWASSQTGYNDFVINPYGSGWHLDRALFDGLLTEAVRQSDIRLLEDRRFVRSRALPSQGFELELLTSDGRSETFTTRFVVDATGTGSAFARSLGARPQFLDHLCCIYGYFTNLTCGGLHSNSTLLEATEKGWWYLAPVPGDRIAVAFATDPETMRANRFNHYEPWMANLLRTSLIASRLGGHQIADATVSARPAPSFLLTCVSGDGWLAVGDAASCYDPIAAQGIHKALSTGLAGAKTIADFLLLGKDTFRAYDAAIKEEFSDYLRNRNLLYAYEQRWPEATFWKQRRLRTRLTEEVPIEMLSAH